eukprot:3745927-Pyramimonas_sp.AAC.1
MQDQTPPFSLVSEFLPPPQGASDSGPNLFPELSAQPASKLSSGDAEAHGVERREVDSPRPRQVASRGSCQE